MGFTPVSPIIPFNVKGEGDIVKHIVRMMKWFPYENIYIELLSKNGFIESFDLPQDLSSFVDTMHGKIYTWELLCDIIHISI